MNTHRKEWTNRTKSLERDLQVSLPLVPTLDPKHIADFNISSEGEILIGHKSNFLGKGAYKAVFSRIPLKPNDPFENLESVAAITSSDKSLGNEMAVYDKIRKFKDEKGITDPEFGLLEAKRITLADKAETGLVGPVLIQKQITGNLTGMNLKDPKLRKQIA